MLAKLLITTALLTLSPFARCDEGHSEATQVTVKFKTQAEAREFMQWMSGQGEQDMFIWMDENMPSLSKVPDYNFEALSIDFTQD